MRAQVFVLTVCAVLAGGSTVSAQQVARHPDFKGVWRMDTTKFAKHDALLAALTLTVAQRGDTVTIITDVADTGRAPLQMRSWYLPAATTAASVSPPTYTDSRISAGSLAWEGDTLILRRTEHRPDRTLEIVERWALDSTGHTLSRYQDVRDGSRRSRQTLMFTRQ